MVPAYKLIYFDVRGVAECCRYLLKYGGIEFEDVRIKREDWPKMKDKTPFGQLPVLEHKGKQAAQSLAIARYLAKQVKLAGNDDWENLEIDSVVDAISELRGKLTAVHREQDETKKKTMKETIIKEAIPYYFTKLETLVQKNNGHLALGRLTWADLYFASMALALDIFMDSDACAKYPNLKKLRENVESIPAIKKWIAERPQTAL